MLLNNKRKGNKMSASWKVDFSGDFSSDILAGSLTSIIDLSVTGVAPGTYTAKLRGAVNSGGTIRETNTTLAVRVN